MTPHPGHHIAVTPLGVFGRVVFECECGIERRYASYPAAEKAALRHHERVSKRVRERA